MNQQDADIALALSLLSPTEWTDQDTYDACYEEKLRISDGLAEVYSYRPGDFVPPYNYSPTTRHIWGVQLAMRFGLVEGRKRHGLIEYRISQAGDTPGDKDPSFPLS